MSSEGLTEMSHGSQEATMTFRSQNRVLEHGYGQPLQSGTPGMSPPVVFRCIPNASRMLPLHAGSVGGN